MVICLAFDDDKFNMWGMKPLCCQPGVLLVMVKFARFQRARIGVVDRSYNDVLVYVASPSDMTPDARTRFDKKTPF